MSIFRFRITFDEFDDIHRDIDFEASHTFADLFLELLKAISFDNKHKGEFYLADHNLRKGNKIGEISGDGLAPMNKVELVDHIDDPHQKFLFTYDPDVRWNFNIELIKIMGSPEYKVTYPKVANVTGAPPVQYKETLIIPTRERTEPDGRGRKPKPVADEEDIVPLFAGLVEEDDETDAENEIAESAADEISLELPADMDLETDNEIAKLAEEFNNTIDTADESAAADDEELGFSSEDDEYGSSDGEDDEYGSGGGGGYGGRDEFEE